MGTRSLLAVETKPEKYHVQYMQFDGSPSCKGIEYYAAILKALQVHPASFMLKSGLPNKKFRERILTYLNEIQYQTGHSLGNHYEITADEWRKQDCWQEWQYLFKYNGDFEFFHTYSASDYTYIIPWQLTLSMAVSLGTDLMSPYSHPDGLPLHTFFEENNWVPENKNDLLRLKVSQAELLAFPEQEESGWRTIGTLYSVNGKGKENILFESFFVKSNKGTKIRKRKDLLSEIKWCD